MTEMTHQNLPALNRYTSETQYEAMRKVQETKSIVPIVYAGGSSRTLGSLVRSMWIKSEVFTDEQGVTREGWFVTPEGVHAMKLYEIKKAEEDRERAEAERLAEHMLDVALKYMEADDVCRFAEFKYKMAAAKKDKFANEFNREFRLNEFMKKQVFHQAKQMYVRKRPDEHEEVLKTLTPDD